MAKHQLWDMLEGAQLPESGKAFYLPSIAGYLLGWGPTVPSDEGTGWAPGALFIHTDGSGAEDVQYVNVGTVTSCNFDVGEADLEGELAAITNGNGASKVGVEDADGFLTAATVEAALAELAERDLAHALVVLFDDFLGSAYSASALPHGWTIIDTSAAGTPTLIQSADQHGGAVEFKFDTNDEAEAIGMDHGDELLFDIGSLLTFECRFRAPTLNAADEVIIGMISAQNDAPASLTEGAWFSVDGNQDIDCESDDTSHRNDDKDSLANLGNDVWCSVKIDFSDLSDVKFYTDVAGGRSYTEQASGVTFDLSSYAGNLQPAMFITKSGGAHQTNLDIDWVRIVATR